jgi:flap endonuclease-1
MGTQITDILIKKEIAIKDLQNKILVVDAFNMLYQFLTTIRGPDGSPLSDSKGQITSHLVGLFSRTSNLMQKNLKLGFVFDGVPPDIKKLERERRKKLKIEAKAKYDEAKRKEDVDEMKKYAGRTSVLTKEMVDEAKLLIQALGLPIIQAPSEGEAQAAHMVKRGDAYALISQDTDCLLFGTPYMIKNLSITGRKKKAGTVHYEPIQPEIISLKENLKNLKLTQDQLIILGILVGTDFNIGGIKGIGPKKALKLLQEIKEPKKIFEEAGWKENFEFSWETVFDVIKKMPVTDEYELKWEKPDKEKIKQLLIEKHDFGTERVNSTLTKLEEYEKEQSQRGLGDFF